MTYYRLYIRNLVLSILAIFTLVSVVSMAQGDNNTPPPGYRDSCDANPGMFESFGTYCLNPVTWNQPGIIQQPYPTYRIDTWVWFREEDGSITGGVVAGYWWHYAEQRYHYRVTTGLVETQYGFAEVYRQIPPESIIVAQESNSE